MTRAATIAASFGNGRLTALVSRHAGWPGVIVVNYHRVGDASSSCFDRVVFSATAEQFERQVSYAARYLDVVGPEDLVHGVPRGRGRRVMLTFDDGYRDNYSLAFPILRRHGVKATFFVTTGFLDIGTVAWWDEIAWMVRNSPRSGIPAGTWLPEPVSIDHPDCEDALFTLISRYKELPAGLGPEYLTFLAQATGSGRCPTSVARDVWMTWDMLREMRAGGMSVGAHTVSHPLLDRLPADEQEAEIAGAKMRLEHELGERVSAFSYPEGTPSSFNADTRACLERNDFDLAFSFYGGSSDADSWDRFDVRRTAASDRTPAALVRAAVTRRGARIVRRVQAAGSFSAG